MEHHTLEGIHYEGATITAICSCGRESAEYTTEDEARADQTAHELEECNK